MSADAAEAQMDILLAIGPGHLRNGDPVTVDGDLLAAILTLIDPACPISDEARAHPVIARVGAALAPVHYREAAASIRAIADGMAYAWQAAHAKGMRRAADLLDSTARDLTEGEPDE